MAYFQRILILLSIVSCNNVNNNIYENLYKEGDFDQCVNTFEDVHDTSVLTTNDLFFAGLSYRELSEPCRSLNQLYKCLYLDPTYPNLQEEIERTEILAALSPCSFEDSLDMEIFRTSTIFTESYIEKYERYKAENKLDTALIAIRYALKTNPSNPNLNEKVATTFKALNMKDSALHFINIAAALEPNNYTYILNRAVIEAHFGLHSYAQKDFDHALEITDNKCLVLKYYILFLEEIENEKEMNTLQKLQSISGCL